MSHEITVTFTPPPVPSKPGSWQFQPTDDTVIPHGEEVQVSFLLNIAGGSGTDDWSFKAVTIGQNKPQTTTFVSVQATTPTQTYPDLGEMTISFNSEQVDVKIKNESTGSMTLGVALTVGNGKYLYTSRDPQIVLGPGG